MKKTAAAKALPAPEKPKGLQFIFIPETKESRTVGWPTSITAVVAVAVNEPRATKLTWQPVTGGMVLADDVDVIAILDEGKKNGLNNSLARQKLAMQIEYKAALQSFGARVSEYTRGAAQQRSPQPATVATEAQPVPEPEASPADDTGATGLATE